MFAALPVNISGDVPWRADDEAEESEVQGALAEDLAVGGGLGHHLGPGQVDVTVDGLGIPETGLRVPGKLLGLRCMLGAVTV